MADPRPSRRRRSTTVRALAVVFLVLGVLSVGLAVWLQAWYLWLIAAVNLGTAYQIATWGGGGARSARR